MNEKSELIFSEDIQKIISDHSQYFKVKTLVLDTKVNCNELDKLCDLAFFQNLEYLLFYNLECNTLPVSFSKLGRLEKLIINSAELDHLPEIILELPSLKHLQLDVMDYKTYLGLIPDACILEELEFQSTQVKDLGNLVNISTLKTVGIEDISTIKTSNENIKLLVH